MRSPILGSFRSKREEPGDGHIGVSNLPTGIWLQARDLHAIDGASWSRDVSVWWTRKVVLATRATCKLDSEAFALEFGSVYVLVRVHCRRKGEVKEVGWLVRKAMTKLAGDSEHKRCKLYLARHHGHPWRLHIQ